MDIFDRNGILLLLTLLLLNVIYMLYSFNANIQDTDNNNHHKLV